MSGDHVRPGAPEAEPRHNGDPAARRSRGDAGADPTAAAWRVIAAAGARAARWPWWVQVGALYVAARFVSACIFMAAALHQGVNPWFPAKPDYWSFVNIWDARWYGEALQNGYPEVLPTDEAGNVQENAWAFYALFPMLGRVVSGLTGMPPAAALTLIAVVAGLGAALAIYSLFRRKASHRTALWATVFVATFPVSPVLQVPYAESLNLLLLASALLLVVERRYLLAMPVVILMCLSRPTGVPFAAMVGLLFLYRAWQSYAAARGPSAAAGIGGHSTGPSSAVQSGTVTSRPCRTAGRSSGRWPG